MLNGIIGLIGAILTVLTLVLTLNGCVSQIKANPDTNYTIVCVSDFPDRCWRDARNLCTEGYDVVDKDPLTFKCLK